MSKEGRINIFWRIFNILPWLTPVWLAVFGAVLVVFLLLERHGVSSIVIGAIIATIISVLVARLLLRNTGSPTKEAKVAVSFISVFALLWTGFNANFAFEHVLTNRDPAIYLVTGMMLTERQTTNWELHGILDDEHTVEESAGFEQSTIDGEQVGQTQALNVLPLFLSVFGQIGERPLMAANTVFGGLAIIAVFAFARLLMRERWAVVAAMTLAASMPLVYFSRDSYTEPLSIVFIFGALALITIAARAKQHVPWLWLVAGLVTGASALVRIDAPLSIAGLMFGAGLAAWFTASKFGLSLSLTHIGLFMLGLVVMVVLGLLDGWLMTRYYFEDQMHNIVPQYIVLGVELAVIVAGIFVFRYGKRFLEWLNTRTINWRAVAVVVLIVSISLFLASRPLWFTGTRAHMNHIELMQAGEQYAPEDIDGTRSYSEYTVNWMVWYLGLPIVLLSVIGFSVAAYRSMRSRDIAWLMSLAVIFAVGAVYFMFPTITPDQIWASRRFLPAVMPGIAIFGALGLAWLYGRKKWPFGIDKRFAVGVIATLTIIAPLAVTEPLIRAKEYNNVYSMIYDICEHVDDDTLLLWGGQTSRQTLYMPVWHKCDVSSVGMRGDTRLEDSELLRQYYIDAEEAGYELRVGMLHDEIEHLDGFSVDDFTLASQREYHLVQEWLNDAPTSMRPEAIGVYIGIVDVDGSIRPTVQE